MIARGMLVAVAVMAVGFASSRSLRADVGDDRPLPKLDSARHLLELYGIDDDRLAAFTDGGDIDGEHPEALLRVMIAARRFSFGDWHRWRQIKLPWSQWAADSQSVRGNVYEFHGEVTRVTLTELPEEIAERFDLTHYWRCEFRLDDDQQSAIVYALDIPEAWEIDTPIHERSGASAVFLQLASSDRQVPQPVFVAARAAWYPDTELGNLGMDVGLFDTVEDRTRLQTSDGPCFYELLAAASRANQRELLARPRDKTPEEVRALVESLFNRPENEHGRLVALTGTTERVVEVRIDNKEVVDAIGIDRYYEMELVTADSQGNPITFCSLELPPGMPRGETVTVDVRVAGFFFKVWAYPIAPREGTPQVQMAPLIVGRIPVLVPKPIVSNVFSSVVTAALLAGIVVVGAGLWWMNRSDARERQRLRRLERKIDVPLDDAQ